MLHAPAAYRDEHVTCCVRHTAGAKAQKGSGSSTRSTSYPRCPQMWRSPPLSATWVWMPRAGSQWWTSSCSPSHTTQSWTGCCQASNPPARQVSPASAPATAFVCYCSNSVPYCTVLHFTGLGCAVLDFTALSCTVLYHTIPCAALL